MAIIGQVTLLIWLAVLASVDSSETAVELERDAGPAADAQAGSGEAAGPAWATLKKGLEENRHSMCSFLLLQVSSKQVELTLKRVTELFEQALDHMAKSTEYTTLIRPFIKAGTIEEFDKNGGATVLQISEERRALIGEYRQASAEGSSEADKAAILEKYFLKACAHKLGTVLAERSLYSTVIKLETIIEKKPASLKSKLSGFGKLASFVRRRQAAAEPEQPSNPPGLFEQPPPLVARAIDAPS